MWTGSKCKAVRRALCGVALEDFDNNGVAEKKPIASS